MTKMIFDKMRVLGLAFVLILTVVYSPEYTLPMKWWSGSVKEKLLAYFISIVFYLILALIIFKIVKSYQLSHDIREKFQWKYLIFILLAYFSLEIIDVLIDIWLNAIGKTETANQEDLNQMAGQFPFVVTLINSAIVAPIVEEVMVRGLLNKVFFKNWRLVGIVFSSLVFGLFHGPTDLPSWFFYADGGLVFAFLYETTDDLTYPILLHIFNNFLATVINWL
ncbi:lysostaphin resistance A-like protein [Streptococcus hillyeri]|uniref:CPBP family intramembrane glutamic endopeptidase n=1 Tax=Streptococcus hillyeri TaxID=2282420 RepID=UPI0034E26050